jgi:triosephosphate isomerase
MQMVKDLGCRYVLCGHSDRRQFHGETDAFVAEQANAARALGLIPIICIGETLEKRRARKAKEVITRQLAPLPLDAETVLAYEPVWAISRGDPTKPAATTKDAEEMHALIRSLLPEELRSSLRIIYGGSMKGENAEELLREPNIDGGLVGNASLTLREFQRIVDIAASTTKP